MSTDKVAGASLSCRPCFAPLTDEITGGRALRAGNHDQQIASLTAQPHGESVRSHSCNEQGAVMMGWCPRLC